MAYLFSFKELQEAPAIPIKKPSFLSATDSIRLAYYPFIPTSNPQAIVVFFHGARVYTNIHYQRIGLTLETEWHIGTYLLDLRGHGHSEGPRGDAPHPSQVWHDINSILSLVRANHPRASIFLAGHSAGGGLILNYLAWEKTQEVDGYLFLAPYLGPNTGTIRSNPRQQHSFISKIRTWAFALYHLTGRRIGGHLPAVFFNHSSDTHRKLNVPYYTVAMARAMTPLNAQQSFAMITKPFALLCGKEDEAFDPQAMMVYADFAPVSIRQRSHTEIIPQANHLSILLNAPEAFARAIKKITSHVL